MSQRDERSNPPLKTGGPYQQGGLRVGRRAQYFELPFARLVSYVGGEESSQPKKQFRVTTGKSSQVRTKISVNFEIDDGAGPYPDITGAGNTIWIAASDEQRGGAGSSDVPNSSVEGTRAAPTPFPSTVVAGVVTLDPGLLGYSREFVTSADYLIGEVNMPASGFAGTWVIVVSVQPDGVVLPDDAWADICSKYNVIVGNAPT